jgi:biotin synthase
MNLQEILNKTEFTKEEIIFLLNLQTKEDLALLFEKADAIKGLYFGRTKSKIAAIQFSNNCENNCLYCELSEDNLSVPRFRLSPDEILGRIRKITANNINNIVLQSGFDNYYDKDMISYLIYKIKKEYEVQITLSLLQRELDEYRAWKFVGADNYLLKFNTSNKENFSNFNKSNTLQERVNHIKYLKKSGYNVCTGSIIGLPNQSKEDIANDLLLLNEINPEMVFNTPFVPKYYPKFQNLKKIDFVLMQKIFAITRILLKKSDLIISDSDNFFDLNEKKELFEVGANILLIENYSSLIKKDGNFTKIGSKNTSSKDKIAN